VHRCEQEAQSLQKSGNIKEAVEKLARVKDLRRQIAEERAACISMENEVQIVTVSPARILRNTSSTGHAIQTGSP
jgi:hypothetical protein